MEKEEVEITKKELLSRIGKACIALKLLTTDKEVQEAYKSLLEMGIDSESYLLALETQITP